MSSETNHFVSFSGEAGYTAMPHSIEGVAAGAGLNTAIGCTYRYYHNHFFLSLGLQGSYRLVLFQMSEMDFRLPMRDTEGDLFDMNVRLSRSRDVVHMVNVGIPLLVGGEWGRFYFLAGPVLVAGLYGSASSKAVYTTFGGYDRYYDDFYDMPDHQFVSDQTMKSGVLPLRWNFDVMAHLEIGGRIDKHMRERGFYKGTEGPRMYLALYADVGLLNAYSGGETAPVFDYRETPDAGLQFFVRPLLCSSLAQDAFVRNINVGVKYTIAIELPKPSKSYIYDWHRVGHDFRKRGGTQAIKD